VGVPKTFGRPAGSFREPTFDPSKVGRGILGEIRISRSGKFLVQTFNWKREPGNKSSPAHNSRFPEPLFGSGLRLLPFKGFEKLKISGKNFYFNNPASF